LEFFEKRRWIEDIGIAKEWADFRLPKNFLPQGICVEARMGRYLLITDSYYKRSAMSRRNLIFSNTLDDIGILIAANAK
jgi:hypothetical protein